MTLMFRLAPIRCLTLVLTVYLFALGACSGRPAVTDTANAESPVPVQAGQQLVASAKLVVVVVLDQLPSEALLFHSQHLSKDGILRRAMDTGLFEERARFDYAGTNTAPGHASIHTGEVPADHGIDSNDVWNYQTDQRVSIIADGEHRVFGSRTTACRP